MSFVRMEDSLSSERILRNFRCLDAVIGSLNTRRNPAHLEAVLESVGRMIGESFTEKDLATVLYLCPDAFIMKMTSNHLISITTNNYWPHRSSPHNASHVCAESRLNEYRNILATCSPSQIEHVPPLQCFIESPNVVLSEERSSKRQKKVKSESLRQILDQVATSQEKTKYLPPPTSNISVESLRESVICRSRIQSTKAQADLDLQRKIDRLSVTSMLQTTGDLIKLFCRLQQKSIFPLQEVLKYLSSSLHLPPTFLSSLTSLPEIRSPLPYHYEYVLLVKLSEAVPEYLAILPADEANGVPYATVRINLSAPMGDIREKLKELSKKAAVEKKRLLSEVS